MPIDPPSLPGIKFHLFSLLADSNYYYPADLLPQHKPIDSERQRAVLQKCYPTLDTH